MQAVDHSMLQTAVEALLRQTCDMMVEHDDALALAKVSTWREGAYRLNFSMYQSGVDF